MHAFQEELRDPTVRKQRKIKGQFGLVKGPAVSALIGLTLPKFCILGPLVTEAEEMSSMLCPAGKVLVSKPFKESLQNFKFSEALKPTQQANRPIFYLENRPKKSGNVLAPVLLAFSK